MRDRQFKFGFRLQRCEKQINAIAGGEVSGSLIILYRGGLWMLIKVITIIECRLKACSHPSCMNNSLILQNKNLSVFVLENDSQKSRPIANYYAFKITRGRYSDEDNSLCTLKYIWQWIPDKWRIDNPQSVRCRFNSFYNTVVHRFTAHVWNYWTARYIESIMLFFSVRGE